MLVAWSAMRSRLREISSTFSAGRVHRGSSVHLLHQDNEGLVLHAVDDAVHLQHGLGDFGFAIEECLQRALHHGADAVGHARNIDRQLDFAAR